MKGDKINTPNFRFLESKFPSASSENLIKILDNFRFKEWSDLDIENTFLELDSSYDFFVAIKSHELIDPDFVEDFLNAAYYLDYLDYFEGNQTKSLNAFKRLSDKYNISLLLEKSKLDLKSIINEINSQQILNIIHPNIEKISTFKSYFEKARFKFYLLNHENFNYIQNNLSDFIRDYYLRVDFTDLDNIVGSLKMQRAFSLLKFKNINSINYPIKSLIAIVKEIKSLVFSETNQLNIILKRDYAIGLDDPYRIEFNTANRIIKIVSLTESYKFGANGFAALKNLYNLSLSSNGDFFKLDEIIGGNEKSPQTSMRDFFNDSNRLFLKKYILKNGRKYRFKL